MATPDGLLYWKLLLRSRFKSRKRAPLQDELDINRHAYRVFSQNREDGIIAHLIERIAEPTQQCVEFGFAPAQCNCTNLIVNHGYGGLLMDGGAENCAQAERHLTRFARRPLHVEQAFLDLDNLNSLIGKAGVGPRVDVLSIDVDGNDYWFWRKIELDAWIVVMEYNASFGAERAITVPYDAQFRRHDKHPSGFYHGVSLPALHKLGSELGYALVGTDLYGVNAFFVREALLGDDLPARSVAEVFRPHHGRMRHRKKSPEEQYAMIADLPFVEV